MIGLHLASFDGNIGDAANHNGFWHSFEKYVGNSIYDILEIREFYKSWNKRKFDDDFVKMVNSYDYLVIGGGNFFECIWDYSHTGTTIDISEECLSKINIPIIINGVGVDDKNGQANIKNIEKLGYFLKLLKQRKNSLVSVRNDGSYDLIKKYYSKEIVDSIIEIPDGGFFTTAKDYFHPELSRNSGIIIAVNLACDRIQERLDGSSVILSYGEYCESLSKSVNNLLLKKPEINIVFVPHIVKDLEIISMVLSKIEDEFRRLRITVAPLVNGTITPADYIVDLYKKSNLVVGMRYHSNVCAIAMETPTVAIVNFKKHKDMYHKIGLETRIVTGTGDKYFDNLEEKILNYLTKLPYYKEQNQNLLKKLEIKNREYFEKIKKILIENN